MSKSVKILSNSDLCFVYFAVSELVHSYEDIIESGKVIHVLEIDENNQMTRITHLTEEQLERISNQSDYIKAKSIQTKLEPVIDLIQESSPEIYEEILHIFENRNKRKVEDDDEEEDENM